jgi:GDP-4-dehydro-6-deoxy-D-mannose reductase
VTGAGGFVGTHLTRFLSGQKKVRVFDDRCDLRDPRAVKRLLSKIKPDRIFHLAAFSFVPASWLAPEKAFDVNVLGTLHIFEALKSLNMRPALHVAGSSEAYGTILPSENPVDESVPFRPSNPYGVSKAAQEILALQYGRSLGLPVIVTRAFFHTGPGQKQEFVASSFARQVAMIEAGLQKPVIAVGNLKLVRDFTDVRDVVRAYWLALEKAKAGEVYNICSGKGRAIGEILEIYLKRSSVKIKAQVDPARVRKGEIPKLVGDCGKFKNATGWKPRISLETTLLDLLNDWRRKVAAKNF